MSREPRVPPQQQATTAAPPAAVPRTVHEVLHSPGQELPTQTRSQMEARFGHDFSRVRIHVDERAAASAQDIGANAYAFTNHIAFAPGRFNTESERGQRLIAHELAHVVQQDRSHGPATTPDRISSPSDSIERAADAAATQVMNHLPASMHTTAAASTIARDEAKPDDKKQKVTLAIVGTCKSAQKLADTIPGARRMLFAAENLMMSYAHVEQWQQKQIDAVLRAHFGSSEDSVRRTFSRRLMHMSRLMDLAGQGGLTFDCSSPKDEKCGLWGAYVKRGEPRTIHLCPAFFDAGLESRRMLLIHETAHLSGARGTEQYFFKTGPISTADCLDPTPLSTEDALGNADSYAWAVWCLSRQPGEEVTPDINFGGTPDKKKDKRK